MEEADVLIAPQVCRTTKFLCALAKGIPIVSKKWCETIVSSGQIPDVENFILNDSTGEHLFKMNLKSTLEKAKQRKLFENHQIFVGSSKKPSKDEICQIVKYAGGRVARTSRDIEDNTGTLVVGDHNDNIIMRLKNNFNHVKFITVDDFMDAVMRYKI